MDVKGTSASFVITVLIFAKGHCEHMNNTARNWKCSVFRLKGQLVLCHK